MAEQQWGEGHTISLICWNVNGLNDFTTIKNYLCVSKAELCFLQEVIPSNAFLLRTFEEKYTIRSFSEKVGPLNYLMFNKVLFTVEKQVDNVTDRACICILRVNIPRTLRIIVASCHLPRREGKTTDNASNLFANLDKLRRETGYPVIVAGDFNCDITRPTKTTGNRVDLKCFEVPTYNPTIHRVLFSGNHSTCIDFFSYKNCDDVDRSVRVRVDNVCAELIQPSRNAAHSVSWNNGQVNFLQYQQYISKDKSESTLHHIHNISDHDPLKATVTIEVVPPSLELCSYYRENGGEQELITEYFDKLHSSPNLCLNSNRSEATLKSSIPSDNIKIKSATDTNSVHNLKSLQYMAWQVEYKTNASNTAKLCVVLIQKLHTSKVSKEDIKSLFTSLGNQFLPTCATVVAGDFNIYKFLREDPNITGPFNVPRYNPTMHSLVYGGIDNDHISFFTFQNSSNGEAVKISLSNVRAEMIASCPSNHLTTQSEQPCFNYYLCHKELAKIHAASPYDPLLATITFGVTPSFHILYSDIKYSKLDEICQYFSGLNSKPDLCIYKDFNEFTMQQLCRGFETVDKQCRHLIAYDSSKFAYKKCVKLLAPWSSFVGVHIFQCLGVAGNPQFILVTYVDYFKPADKIKYIEAVFKYCNKMVVDCGCPVYVAGQFDVDMYKVNRHGLEVLMYAPTVYNMIHCKNNICRNYFAYKNPTSDGSTITVSDVVAEMIIPNPGLVTGLSNVNISEDFEPSIVGSTNLEALRATMRIEMRT